MNTVVSVNISSLLILCSIDLKSDMLLTCNTYVKANVAHSVPACFLVSQHHSRPLPHFITGSAFVLRCRFCQRTLWQVIFEKSCEHDPSLVPDSAAATMPQLGQ